MFLRSGQFLGDEIRAGETTTRTAVVENAGDGPVSVVPVVVSERGGCRGSSPPGALPGELVTVDAPTEIAPGEPVRIEFTVAPPEGADVGRYGAEYTLGIDDPARPDDDDYRQQADLEVGIWRVPGESITRSFEVRAEDDAETVTLSARTDGERPGFRVALVSPIGARYEREPTTVRWSGGVDFGDADGHRDGGLRYEITSTFDLGRPGGWTLAVRPRNTPRSDRGIVTGNRDR